MTTHSELAVRGQQFHQQGNLAEARRLYRQSLAVEETPDVLHALGVLELQSGRIADAVTHLCAAQVLEPNNAQLLSNLGHAYGATGDHGAAIQAYTNALEREPNSAETLAGLGNAHLAQNAFGHAADAYAKALQLNPWLLDLWRCRATALLASGHHEAALLDLDKGDALAREQQIPVMLPSRMTRGNVLMSMGRLEEALDCFSEVVRAEPTFVHGLISQGNAYRELDSAQAAKDSYEKALACDPHNSDALTALGLVHQDSGDLPKARAFYERAVAQAPLSGKANRLLAAMTHFTPEHPGLARLQQAVARESVARPDRAHLHLAYAKALEDCHRDDEAFTQFSKGNALHRETLNYTVSTDEQTFAAIQRVCGARFFHPSSDATNSATSQPTPIFVIGMPRSGTSLIEQILASHRDVIGAGELNDFEFCLNQVLAEKSGRERPTSVGVESPAAHWQTNVAALTQNELKEIGERYLQRLSAHQADGWVVDKMPANFRFVALIRAAISHAVIVVAERHPVATCWSIYKHFLGTAGHAYSFSLDELARYYKAYDRLMAHWNALDSQLITIRYEDLVTKADDTIRDLVARSRLTWDDACLDFHRTRRPVKTLSAAQVRRPIYTSAVSEWERYSAGLHPLVESLQELIERY